MFKYITLLVIVISFSTEIFGTLNFLRAVIENTDTNITRVRTLEERNKRSGEFVVLDFIGLVEQYDGYTAEEYDVETEDGYILKLHRISGSPLSPKAPGKPVIYLGHGLFGSSDFHVVLGRDQALLFLLADAGYDVWIGNFRGNTYSKRHVKYSSAGYNRKFWDFSMDEMGTIDLPKLIDTVLEKTNQEKLTYIGYSMGTTISYILLSAKPEYNEKMNLVVSIAPEAIFTRPFSPLVNSLMLLMPAAKALVLANRVYQILPQSKLINIVGKDICASELGKLFCGTFLTSVAHPDQMNYTALPTVLSHVPAGSSFKVIEHYSQMITSGEFKQFDYGFIGNPLKYRSIVPAEYDLTKISSPQAIFYSPKDVYASARDIKSFRDILPNVVAFEEVPDNYNHLDFMWHRDARTDIYYRILEVIEKNVL